MSPTTHVARNGACTALALLLGCLFAVLVSGGEPEGTPTDVVSQSEEPVVLDPLPLDGVWIVSAEP